jgi:hypothetical protein
MSIVKRFPDMTGMVKSVIRAGKQICFRALSRLLVFNKRGSAEGSKKWTPKLIRRISQ